MVITKKALQTQKAQDIQKRATQRALTYDTGALQQIVQQKTVLGGQRQALVQSANTTLGDINQNIYRAQRQQRAQSASAGLIGGVNEARATADLQSQITSELAGVLGQVEQGAVALGAQQSALNEAETQMTLNEILDIYSQDLIDSGDPSVSRAWGKQIFAGIGGGLLGGIGGALAGATAGWGVDKVKKGGGFVKSVAGAGVGIGALGLSDTIAQSIANIQGTGDEYKEANQMGQALPFVAGAGALAGAGVASPRIAQNIRDFREKKGLGEAVGLRDYRNIAKGNAPDFQSRKIGLKKGLRNPWTIGIGAALGGTIGAIAGGSKARYNLDYDKFIKSDVARDFASMGIDLAGIEALIEK